MSQIESDLDVKSSSHKTYSPYQFHLLIRVHRMQQLKEGLDNDPTSDPNLTRLVGKALFSTFQDCQAEGISSVARRIMLTIKHGV